jgi:hypothetical protein
MGLLLLAGAIGPTRALAVSRSPFTSARTVGATPGEQLAYCARAARSSSHAPRAWKNKSWSGKTWKGQTWKGTTWTNKDWKGKAWQARETRPKEWKSVARIKAESR